MSSKGFCVYVILGSKSPYPTNVGLRSGRVQIKLTRILIFMPHERGVFIGSALCMHCIWKVYGPIPTRQVDGRGEEGASCR